MNIAAIIAWVIAHWGPILQVLLVVYGALAALVKLFPTLPDTGVWAVLLWIVKILGKITNRQTNDAAVRAAKVAQK